METDEGQGGPIHRNRHLLRWLAAAIALAALLGVLARLFLFGDGGQRELIDIDPSSGNLPHVAIRVPSPGARVPAMDPVPVMVQASGGGKIVRYELWVDGGLARQQLSPESDSALPASGRLQWLPGSAGAHVLVARAFDAEGRMGRSRPVVVEAVARPDDGLVGVTVDVQPGDTVESIAQAFGTSPDMIRPPNVGAEPQAGEQVVVMLPPDRIPGGYTDDDGLTYPAASPEASGAPPSGATPEGGTQTPAEGGTQTPAEGGTQTPAEGRPQPADAGVGEAEPVDNAAPDELPGGFRRVGDPEPPAAPEGLSASHEDGCSVRLEWSDSSDSETGFRVYRSDFGAEFRPIQDLEANGLAYTDRVWLGGHYEYYVASVNAGGESDSNLAGVDVPDDECSMSVGTSWAEAMATLQFEWTSLATETSYDDAYCYLSLARLEPYARVPDNGDLFLAPTASGSWDIDQYASGIDRLIFGQPPSEPVPVRMECWGRRGDEQPELLGSFEASHSREEWDGRNLFCPSERCVAAAGGAAFRVAYHIEPYESLARAFYKSVEDPRIPAPSWVRRPGDADECEEHADFEGGNPIPGQEAEGPLAVWACREIPPEKLIIWEWEESPAFPRGEIDGFRVFVNRKYGSGVPGAETWQVLGEMSSVNQMFPISGFVPSCGETFAFRVTAMVRTDIPGAEDRESPPSAPFVYNRIRSGPPCQPITVEITLVSLEVEHIDDGVLGGTAVEAYGVGGFNVWHSENYSTDYGQNFFFWTHDCGGQGQLLFGRACLGFDPHDVESGVIRFEEENLATCDSGVGPCTDYGPNHNSFRLEVSEGDRIEFWFNLRDDDDGFDDTWCGTDEDYNFESDIDESKPFSIGPYTYNEWDTLWGPFEWDNSGHALSDQDADCTLMVWVKTWTVGEDVD
jgi:hypothetical protein